MSELKNLNFKFYIDLQNGLKVTTKSQTNATYNNTVVNFTESVNFARHKWFYYKEGFSPSLVKKLLTEFNVNSGLICDPFNGAGTTLTVANELNLKSIGFEVNPFAVFISNVKNTTYNSKDIENIKKFSQEIFDSANCSIDFNKYYKYIPENEYIQRIFDEDVMLVLLYIRENIKKIKEEKVKNLLLFTWLNNLEALANYKKAGNGLKKKSKKPDFTQASPLETLAQLMKSDLESIIKDIEMSMNYTSNPIHIHGSATHLNEHVKDNSLDAVIFSPPYANCFDYTKIYIIELWMGEFITSVEDQKDIRMNSVRSHVHATWPKRYEDFYLEELHEIIIPLISSKELWSKKIPEMLNGYFADMNMVLKNIYDALKPGCSCAIIVSNSAYGGVIVPTDVLLAKIAEKIGFKVLELEVERLIITSSQQYKETEENKEFLRESIIKLQKPKKNEEQSRVNKVEEIPELIKDNDIFEIIPNKANIISDSHRFFNKYPAKYIPQIPRWAIKKYAKNSNSKILDPFNGSGTTIVEGILLGHEGFGAEVDPFARLLTTVKTTPFNKIQQNKLKSIFNLVELDLKTKQDTVLVKPNIPDLNKWFNEENVLKLSIIKESIIEHTKDDMEIRNFLLIVFAAIIRKSSNAENGSPKPYISTRFPKTPVNPFEEFLKTFYIYEQSLINFSKKFLVSENELSVPKVKMVSNDAREIPLENCIDLAVTSPPYINAFDYVRSLKFENYWLDLADSKELLKIRKDNIGTESLGAKSTEVLKANIIKLEVLDSIINKIRLVDEKRAAIVSKYFNDMYINLEAVYKSLKPGAHYIIVVGDSKIRNIEVPTAQIIYDIGEVIGYEKINFFHYVIRDRYLHIPRSGQGGLIKLDNIIVIKKPAR